jgi:hypothetical protein
MSSSNSFLNEETSISRIISKASINDNDEDDDIKSTASATSNPYLVTPRIGKTMIQKSFDNCKL